MPSSEKTTNLGLNRWLGEDKPKREDFNLDNTMVDAAIGEIRQSLDELGDGGAGAAAKVAQDLGSHAANTTMHVTAAEKQEMLSGGFVSGTYDGDGNPVRTITLGFKPKVGIIHGVTPNVYDGTVTLVYHDYFSETGRGTGSDVADSGFMVYNLNAGAPYQARLNETGKTYVYTVWK